MGSNLMWVQQPNAERARGVNDAGTISETFRSDHGRGGEAAIANGYVPGRTIDYLGLRYEFTDLRVRDVEEGAFDEVTVVYSAVGGGPGQSPLMKKHKAGDQEWRYRVSLESMTAREAIDRGWIDDYPPHTTVETIVHIKKSVMEQRVWSQATKNTQALPNSFASAISRYTPQMAAIGYPHSTGSKWICEDIASEEDGNLILFTYTWAFHPEEQPEQVIP